MKVRSYVNFALIKYWGKKDEALKLPNQASLSYTINNLYTDVKASIIKENEDIIIINGITNPKEALRVVKHLDYIREQYKINYHFKIESNNSVPMAAGLASSASSFAAISYAILSLIKKDFTKEEASRLARVGSGSASRSIFSDFVVWNTGDHISSVANPLNIRWDDFRIIVCLLDKNEKKVSSNTAMKKSLELDSYKEFVIKSKIDLDEMIVALEEKDIDKVGKIAVRNSNMMHDLIEESGITYRTKDSFKLIEQIEKLNKKGIKAYYTMDAGPNVKIITTKKYVSDILKELNDVQTIVCSRGLETKQLNN